MRRWSFGQRVCLQLQWRQIRRGTPATAHNQFNLHEGNAVAFQMSDGYFGSESTLTLFRNFFHSTITGVNLRRFNRRTAVGSIIRQGPIGAGLPNIGNGDSTGTAQLSRQQPWLDWKMTGTLTTRTNNTDGTITLDSGHLIGGLGQVIRLVWGTNHDNQGHLRR